MNTFGTLIEVYRLKKVTYYSIQWDGERETVFDHFVNAHRDIRYEKHLTVIRTWLQKIGNEIGAKEVYFRSESYQRGEAVALPPYIEYSSRKCDLRLYCMRMNDNAVILFGGGEKTTQKAQDCPNVGRQIYLANIWTKTIAQLLKNREITIDSLSGRLIYNKDLLIRYE